MSNSMRVPIRGMHCASCEVLVGESMKQIPDVTMVKVNQRRGEAILYYKDKQPPAAVIRQAVQEAGYNVGEKFKLPWISKNPSDYTDLLHAGVILIVLYFVAKWLNLFGASVNTAGTGVAVALLVGLVAGVSTCMALVGGLVLSISARHAELHPEATALQKFRPHLYFNLGRILGYALLGGVIGLIGRAFQPSAGLMGVLTMVVGGVMIFFGLKLIEIFPVLKEKSITLPAKLAKLFGLHKEVKEYSPKSSIITGALTFFLPCGFTQAMQLFAISTGSFWQGMAIMGLFALGTAPGLLGVGGLTAAFKGRKARLFFMTAGLAVILLGWHNIANGSRVLGFGSSTVNAVTPTAEVQEVNMVQDDSGYSPNVLTVEKGKTVKWIINSKAPFSCASSIVMPKFGISQHLKAGENVIMFTPTETGEIPFSCSMGMYRGKFVVTDSQPSATAGQLAAAAPVRPSGTCGGGGGGCGGCGGNRQPVVQQTGTTETGNAQEQVIKSVYTYNKDIVPNTFTVKKGQPVKYIVDVRENGEGCMSTIMVPSLYNSAQPLIAGRQIVMSFTPTAAGNYNITCAMGVPRGVIKVVD